MFLDALSFFYGGSGWCQIFLDRLFYANSVCTSALSRLIAALLSSILDGCEFEILINCFWVHEISEFLELSVKGKINI